METVKYPIKVEFLKKGEIVNFSQLDLVRIFERALRRSGLPLFFTQGFSPHVKLSFYKGLKLGQEGIVEIGFYFIKPVSLEELKLKLSPHLPQGLSFL